MIGEEIRAAIARKHWSIARAARESGVERTFLSRLVNDFPPPRVKQGRQTAEIDLRYRKLADALGIPDPDAFVQKVIAAQATFLPPEEFSDKEKRFLRHLWERLKVKAKYKADISALLNHYVKVAANPYKRQMLRHRILEMFKSPPSSPVVSSSKGSSSYIGPNDSERPDPAELSKLLETVGDQVYTVQEEYAIDSQFDIAQLLFELSRRVLIEPQALRKAVELAQQLDQPKLKGV